LLSHEGVNKGLKEYNAFIENKEAPCFQELREVTQKPRANEPFFTAVDSKGNFKPLTNKDIPSISVSAVPSLK
jgi:hypothetical protein